MPRRQVANYDFGTIASLTTGSTDGTWTNLGTPWSVFTVSALFSSGTSGTVQLRGASSSGSSAAGIITLATIDNTTQIGYNSSAVPVTWLQARVTAISTGGNPSTITVNALAAG